MTEHTVLIMEEDKAVRKLLKNNLKIKQWRVLQTETGLEGLSVFYQKNPDIVLIDLNLSDMDGLEVLKQIRRKSETPVIIVSARNREKDKIMALDCGADDYVVSPFNMEELKARIRVALRRRDQGMITELKTDSG